MEPCGVESSTSLPSLPPSLSPQETQAQAPATDRIPTARGRLPAHCPGWGAGPRPLEIRARATTKGYWGKGGSDAPSWPSSPTIKAVAAPGERLRQCPSSPNPPAGRGPAGAARRRVGGAHLQSLPSVLLSSALCKCGYWSASFLRAACAHTMKAFMGRLTCGLLLLAPLTRTGMGTSVQS